MLITEGTKNDKLVADISRATLANVKKIFIEIVNQLNIEQIPPYMAQHTVSLILAGIFDVIREFSFEIGDPSQFSWPTEYSKKRNQFLKIKQVKIKLEPNVRNSKIIYTGSSNGKSDDSTNQKIKDMTKKILDEEREKRKDYNSLIMQYNNAYSTLSKYDIQALMQYRTYFGPDQNNVPYQERIDKKIEQETEKIKLENIENVENFLEIQFLVPPSMIYKINAKTGVYFVNNEIFSGMLNSIFNIFSHEIKHSQQIRLAANKKAIDIKKGRNSPEPSIFSGYSKQNIKVFYNTEPSTHVEDRFIKISSEDKGMNFLEFLEMGGNKFPFPSEENVNKFALLASTYYLKDFEIEAFAEEYYVKCLKQRKEKIRKLIIKKQKEKDKSNIADIDKKIEFYKKEKFESLFQDFVLEDFEEHVESTFISFEKAVLAIFKDNKDHNIFVKNNINRDGNFSSDVLKNNNFFTSELAKQNFIKMFESFIQIFALHFVSCAEYLNKKHLNQPLSSNKSKIINIQKLKNILNVEVQQYMSSVARRFDEHYQLHGEPVQNRQKRMLEID